MHARVLDTDVLDVAEAAYHAVRAAPVGRAPEAVALSVRAARQARDGFAYETAASHLRNALAAAELIAPADSEQTCRILIELSEVSGHAGDPAAARTHGLRAAELAARAGDRLLRSRAILAAVEHVPFLERDEELAAHLADRVADLGAEPTAERALLLARLASLGTADVAARAQLTAEAVEVAREVGDRSLRFDIMAARMQALWGSPSYREGRADARELLSMATSADRRVQAHLWGMYHHLTAGELSPVRVHLTDIERIAAATGWGRHRLYAASRRAMLATLTGDFTTARSAIDRADKIARESRDAEADPVRWGLLYTLAWHVDVPTDDAGFLQETATCFLGSSVHRVFRLALAVLAVRTGDRELAAQQLAAATDGGLASLPPDVHLPWLLGLTAWLSAALREPELGAEADRALSAYDDGQAIVVAGAVQWMGTIGHYRGLASAALGDRAAAERRLEAARQTYERIGAKPWAVHAMRDLASVSGRRNPRARTGRAARDALRGTRSVVDPGGRSVAPALGSTRAGRQELPRARLPRPAHPQSRSADQRRRTGRRSTVRR